MDETTKWANEVRVASDVPREQSNVQREIECLLMEIGEMGSQVDSLGEVIRSVLKPDEPGDVMPERATPSQSDLADTIRSARERIEVIKARVMYLRHRVDL